MKADDSLLEKGRRSVDTLTCVPKIINPFIGLEVTIHLYHDERESVAGNFSFPPLTANSQLGWNVVVTFPDSHCEVVIWIYP